LAFEPRFPEAALDLILVVGGTRDGFIQPAYEPAEAAEAFAQQSNPSRLIRQGADVDLCRRKRGAGAVAMSREECQPAPGHFQIGPLGDQIGKNAQDQVVVIGQDR
jgi:hypothetical protein